MIDFPRIAMMASRHSFRNVEEVREDFYLRSHTSKKFRQIDRNFIYLQCRHLVNLFLLEMLKQRWIKYIHTTIKLSFLAVQPWVNGQKNIFFSSFTYTYLEIFFLYLQKIPRLSIIFTSWKMWILVLLNFCRYKTFVVFKSVVTNILFNYLHNM